MLINIGMVAVTISSANEALALNAVFKKYATNPVPELRVEGLSPTQFWTIASFLYGALAYSCWALCRKVPPVDWNRPERVGEAFKLRRKDGTAK